MGGREVVRVDEDLGTSGPSHLSLRLGSLSLIVSTPSLSLQNDSPFTFTKNLCVILLAQVPRLGKTAPLAII